MLCFPNCKINLGLYITRRREDGYHDLETVFYPVAVKDALEIVPAALKSAFHGSGRIVEGDYTANLVWKAFELLRQEYPGKVPELEVYLHKVIPMGAGLGGGSSDAAFMLRLVNDYCRLGMTDADLEQKALQLGSDCPFFIRNTPQFASGRGELMEPVGMDLSGFSIQLICPQVHISTAKAFGMISPNEAAFDLRELPKLPVLEWKDHISNDFEGAVFQLFPDLKDIKKQLYNQGALYASLSGSGSAIYGIFPKGQKAIVQAQVGFEEYIVG